MGPEQGGAGAVVVGVAAHITAAAPGGPRYDQTLTREQRRDQSNGIWLCQNHGKQVDSDEKQFTVEMLRAWKHDAESAAADAVTRPQAVAPPKVESTPDEEDLEFLQSLDLPAEDTVEAVTSRVMGVAHSDLAAFKGMPGWPRHPIVLDLTLVEHENTRPFDVERLALAMESFNEIVVVAAPGTGKTTTALQLTETLLSKQNFAAIYVPLAEWASQAGALLPSLASRKSFQNLRPQHFMLLAQYGRLALILDGWNELDEQSRRRATTDIRALKRDFPEIRIVISTRQQVFDVPISGPTVRVNGLSEDKQVELARALRGTDGEAVLDHAWRTPGLRELAAIPLYLTALVGRTSGDTLPTTKEEVLRMLVEEHEQGGPEAEILREKLFGLHKEFLAALAAEMTGTGNTAIPENRARAAIKRSDDRLQEDGQLARALQPSVVLDALVSFHTLVRSGVGNGAIAFQHQQFQEWYASFHVEGLIRRSFSGDDAFRKQLREEVLNVPAWEEAVLFACERTSRTDTVGVEAVAAAILETMEIDPLLAAEMVYRSSNAVWDEAAPSILAFVDKWHVPGQVDRAVHFMIGSGRSEFALEVWRLISDPDTQVHLPALRAGQRFRPSVLGPDAEKRVAALPDEVRKNVLSEIAGESGMDGIELATKLACGDPSAAIKTAVIESLLFRRADRFATKILRNAPEEVWRELARKGCAEEFADPEVADRLRKEASSAFERETSPLQKLQVLIHGDIPSADSAGRKIAALIEAADFPVTDQNAGWAIQDAFKRFPEETSAALVRRLEAGREVPFHAGALLKTRGLSIESEPLAAAVLTAVERDRVAEESACIVGAKTVGLLIDRVTQISERIQAAGKSDEASRKEYYTLLRRISLTGLTAFADALLDRADTKEPGKIGVLADMVASHGREDSENLLHFDGERHARLVAAVQRWGEVLLASCDSTRSQLADTAEAIQRLPDPSLLVILARLLAEDLARWRRSREEFLAAHRAGRQIDSDARTSWTLQYRRAFAAIGGPEVAGTMQPYLADGGYSGFGVTAAWVLKDLHDREHNISRDGGVPRRSDFADVKSRRETRKKGNRKSSPYAEAILAVVTDCLKSGTDEHAHRHALELACVAFLMPYGDKQALIDALLQLQLPLLAKQKLLKVLAIAGEIVSADMIVAGVMELLEEARTKPWLLGQDSWRLDSWLELLPFSDRPSSMLDIIPLLDARLRDPWRFRRVLSAIGYAPSPEAEDILFELARRDPRFVKEYEWLNALENQGTARAGQLLFELIREGRFVGTSRTDASALSDSLARAIQSHPELRKQICGQYSALPAGQAKELVAAAISEAPDIDGIMLLVKDYAAQKRSFRQTVLYVALRHTLTGQRPSLRFGNMREVFSVASPALRRQLFALVPEGGVLSELAAACLNAIDDIRENYGDVESEPRHPDVSSGRPWPMIANWRKG